MKNEIKEILFLLHNDRLTESGKRKLEDYITNLQTIEQQYSAILSENAELENKITNLEQENDDLKQRLENEIATNLLRQQENERLNNDIKILLRENDNKEKVIIRLNNIINKAIDKIQYIIDYGFDYDGFNTVESLKGLIDMLVDYAIQSKNILNGGDKND